MSKSEYDKRLANAFVKPISDIDDIEIDTKKNGKIKGSEIRRIKSVVIELTDTGKINEKLLYQEMERFLAEVENENGN
jgi:hypothetical protein